MYKFFLLSFFIFYVNFVDANQDNAKVKKTNNINVDNLITLAKIYNKYHSWQSIDENEAQEVYKSFKGSKFEKISNFIILLCSKKNNLLKTVFIKRQSDDFLKMFYIINQINVDLFDKDKVVSERFVKKYLTQDININEALREYYISLFISQNNKNKPYNLSNLNFNIEKMGFLNEEEKKIFYFIFSSKFGYQIYSYFNAKNGHNFIGIKKYILLLPTINGKPYYRYEDLEFKDFNYKTKYGEKSFKSYYMKEYINILFSHYLMLKHFKMNHKKFKKQSLLNCEIVVRKYSDSMFTNEINKLYEY